jgi:hypothetical protein
LNAIRHEKKFADQTIIKGEADWINAKKKHKKDTCSVSKIGVSIREKKPPKRIDGELLASFQLDFNTVQSVYKKTTRGILVSQRWWKTGSVAS